MPAQPTPGKSRLIRTLFPRRIAPHGFWMMLAGVFLIFTPVGFQFELLRDEPLSWTRGLCNAALSGLIATGWCVIGTYRAWLVAIPYTICQFFLFPVVFGLLGRTELFDYGARMSRRGVMILLVTCSIALLSAGFFLFMRSIIREVRRSQAAGAELDVARRVHQSIVPPIELSLPGVRVLAQSRTSSTMGGDLIDVVQREGEIDVFLADVSGHGVKAGIVMAMLKASVRTRLSAGGPLGEILGDVNRVLAELTDPSMFATLACVRVRPRGAEADVEFALAGHLPILHLVSRGGAAQELANQCLPLGIEPNERYVQGRTTAQAGDVLVLMTDGLIEVQSRDGRELGFAEVRRVAESHASGSLESMRDRIMGRVDEHGAQIDDQTLALVRIG